MSRLQDLVDSLNRRLKCPIVIDCLRDNQQVYNTHHGQLDDSRTNRILTRDPNIEAAAYFRPYRTPRPEAPVRIPANAQLGIESRVYMPVQNEDELLGHLWVFDPEGRLSENDLDAVRAAAEATALILNRQQLIADLERSREGELLRDLLSPDRSLQARAALDLEGARLFVGGTPVRALVVQPVHAQEDAFSERRRRDFARAIDEVRAGLTPGHALHLMRNDHGLVVLASKEPVLRSRSLATVAADLRSAVQSALAEDEGWEVLVGVGETQPALADAWTSYCQARDAVRVARMAASFAPVAHWGQLGIYRVLSRLPVAELSVAQLHPGLAVLLQQDNGGVLVQTLECFLDNAGEAKRTAAQLFIHRATLYYRLRRIQAITGADLAAGEERLALHLGIKLARLTGAAAPEASRLVAPLSAPASA